jgi:hypothetical protein
MTTDHIGNLLTQTDGRYSPLQKLLQRSANQRAWTAELRAVLPEPLCYEVEITDIRGPQAHLLCRSAAAATRLRFMSDDLLVRLGALASFAEVRELTFRIARGSV